MFKQLFFKNGNYFILYSDIGESKEKFIERAWYIVNNYNDINNNLEILIKNSRKLFSHHFII